MRVAAAPALSTTKSLSCGVTGPSFHKPRPAAVVLFLLCPYPKKVSASKSLKRKISSGYKSNQRLQTQAKNFFIFFAVANKNL
jgi:hypothetical protein